MSVKDVMSANVVSVSEDTTLEEVMELLSRHRFSGVPVIDKAGKVIGMLSEHDIVRFAENEKVMPFTTSTGWISAGAQRNDIASLQRGMELLSKTAVNAVMTRDVITIKQDTPISEAAMIMNKHKINRLPVIGENEQLIGIVTRDDLVMFLAERDQNLR